MVIEHKFYIGVRDIDENMELKNRAICTYLSDMAGVHSSIKKDKLNGTNFRWILSSYNVKILKKPVFNSIITIKTWSVNYSVASAVREFEVYDESGNILMFATSTWVLVDITSKRIVLLTDDIMEPYGKDPHHTNFSGEKTRLIAPVEFNYKKELLITEHYIDFNNHVNNSYYVMFADNFIKENYEDNLKDYSFMVSFKKEIKEGDKVIICAKKDDNGYTIVLKNEDIVYSIIKFYK